MIKNMAQLILWMRELSIYNALDYKACIQAFVRIGDFVDRERQAAFDPYIKQFIEVSAHTDKSFLVSILKSLNARRAMQIFSGQNGHLSFKVMRPC